MTKRDEIKKYLPNVKVNKNMAWGIAGVVGLAVLIYYMGKSKGNVEQFNIPNPPGNTPLTDDEKRQITQITLDLYSNLGTSWNWLLNWDIVSLNNYLMQPDRIFIGVYNLYTQTYLSSPDTLKSEMLSEMSYALSFTDDYKVMKQITDRMNTLGMK